MSYTAKGTNYYDEKEQTAYGEVTGYEYEERSQLDAFEVEADTPEEVKEKAYEEAEVIDGREDLVFIFNDKGEKIFEGLKSELN